MSSDPAKRRTRILTHAELDEILSVIRDGQFREFMRAMLETGCRPSEVARVTADMVNLEIDVWVLPVHKTAKKTHKPRVVYLTPAMLELSRKLMAEYPEGPIFEAPAGSPPSSAKASAAGSVGCGRRCPT